MLRPCGFPRAATILALAAVGLGGSSSKAAADTITLSGTVSYQGTYSGDTLYVAVIDTVGPEDVMILDLEALAVGAPPFDQPYSLTFDNASAAASVFIASFLDVDGGGVGDVGGADVFGWYDGTGGPAPVSSAVSQSGLDFDLPRAEIRGTLTFAAGQSGEVRPDASSDPLCGTEGFRPQSRYTTSGPYAIVGLYPGTYCVYADGPGPSGQVKVCYGDPDCVSPTTITLTETEVRTGVDLDFNDVVPVRPSTWGRVKSWYR